MYLQDQISVTEVTEVSRDVSNPAIPRRHSAGFDVGARNRFLVWFAAARSRTLDLLAVDDH